VPIIKVWGLPVVPDDLAAQLIKDVQQAVAKAEGLEIGADEVIVLYPADLYMADAGESIIAEICGIFRRPGRTPEVFKALCEDICHELAIFAYRYLPECKSISASVAYTMEPSDLTLLEKGPEGDFAKKVFT